jgi:hypothetical protein
MSPNVYNIKSSNNYGKIIMLIDDSKGEKLDSIGLED